MRNKESQSLWSKSSQEQMSEISINRLIKIKLHPNMCISAQVSGFGIGCGSVLNVDAADPVNKSVCEY